MVRRVFSENVTESGNFGGISRHGVMHGRDLGYATRVNSTKTIVLVAALAEYFPRVANDAGAHPPTEPPWTNADGWRSDNDFPRSPNWECNLVS